MTQKFIQVGSSVGLVIPKPVAQDVGVEKGGTFELIKDGSNRIIIELSPDRSKKDTNPKLIAWAEEAVERYRPALEALKDK